METKINSKVIDQWIKDIHENAVAHGWWDEERTHGEIIALCCSELSEALEEYREGKSPLYYKCKHPTYAHADDDVCEVSNKGLCRAADDLATGQCLHTKPEGIAVELADCLIRVFDYCGKLGISLSSTALNESWHSGHFTHWKRHTATFGDFIAFCNYLFANIYKAKSSLVRQHHISALVKVILKYCDDQKFDLFYAIKIKHAYNKTRPYRHGGKVI